MSTITIRKPQFSRLGDLLQSSMVILKTDDKSLTIREAEYCLDTYKSCCIVGATSKSKNRINNITNLYFSMITLKRIRRQLHYKYSLSNASLIGIYPSLEYPACAYELNTNADHYVSSNILPKDNFIFLKIIKFFIRKLFNIDPTIGGIGLYLTRE